MIHKNIRIPFTVNGRNYEAVGFLNDGESSVGGYEMLRRTIKEPMSDEDAALLDCNRRKWPAEWRKYHLTTGMHYPGRQRSVTHFTWLGTDQRWWQDWGNLDGQWRGDILVVRCCGE